mgnify:CR=1 FL=1
MFKTIKDVFIAFESVKHAVPSFEASLTLEYSQSMLRMRRRVVVLTAATLHISLS